MPNPDKWESLDYITRKFNVSKNITTRIISTGRCWSLLACAVVVMAFPAFQSAYADNVQTTQATLLDRIQIEDLISNYYWDLSSGRHKLSEYYTEDAVLDVNGIVYQGHEGIQSAYDPEGPAGSGGKMHMLMNNPRIRVNGDRATAETIWTGVLSDTVRVAPRLFEQGREYDELVKKDGRWYFSRRVITSDAGLPARYDGTYKER